MTLVTLFQTGFRVDEDLLQAGDLFRKDDNTLWEVQPDGTQSQLGSGGSQTLSQVLTAGGSGGNKTQSDTRITKRVLAAAGPGSTPAINTDDYDVAHFTAVAAAITSMSSGLTGTPVDGDTLRVSFTDNGTARAISWGGSFEPSTVALPTTTVISTRLDVGFLWNTETSKWRCVATA